MKEIRVRLGKSARAALARVAQISRRPVWLVGGAIRDAALGRVVSDLDLTCADSRSLAVRLARHLRGTLVTLDERNAVYRLILTERDKQAIKQIDVAQLQGKNILEDLRRRDFTVNAVALELGCGLPSALPEKAFLDPRGGLKDLALRRIRAEIESNLVDDPLRLLRAFRIAAQLGLSIDAATLKAVRRHRRLVREPAPERVSAELLALLAVPGVSNWLRRMDECGLLTELFEELKPARRCAQSYYGPGGVLTHTLDVCARVDFLLVNLRAIYPRLASGLTAHIAARGGPAFRALLLLAALLHDVAKPDTARRIDGRLRFFEHDRLGAVATEKILRRLRLSREQIASAVAIVRHHLRPGHLAANGRMPSQRAVYRFFRDLGEDAPGLLLVCWGDHASYMPASRLKRNLKTATSRYREEVPPPHTVRKRPTADTSRLPEGARKTMRHLQLVSLLLRRWHKLKHAPPPQRLLDGRDVMKLRGLPPGPKVGELLERVREAQAEGTVRDRDEALAFVARLDVTAHSIAASVPSPKGRGLT